MKKKMCKKWGVLLITGLMLSMPVGCVGKKPIATAPEPDLCGSQAKKLFMTMSIGERTTALNRLYEEDNRCWERLVLISLNEKLRVPSDHLVKAMNAWNRQSDIRRFDQAAQAYLAALADGSAYYGTNEKRFLEAYCRVQIRNAKSNRDPQLIATRDACRSIDSSLYSRFFK